jgi:hypothetical protein
VGQFLLAARVSAVSRYQIDLSWAHSTDDWGYPNYKIYKDGTYYKSSQFIFFTDTGLNPDTHHCYTVSAIDSYGYESTQSKFDESKVMEWIREQSELERNER